MTQRFNELFFSQEVEARKFDTTKFNVTFELVTNRFLYKMTMRFIVLIYEKADETGDLMNNKI